MRPQWLVQSMNNIMHANLDVHFRSIGFSYLGGWLIVSGIICILYILMQYGKIKPPQFYWASALLVIIHYFFLLESNAVNFPLYDDQGAILQFLVNFQKAQTISDQFREICMPYNESLMVFPKLFVLAWFKIFGEINFRCLVIFNGLLLVFLNLLVFHQAPFTKASPLFFIIAVFFFQFQFYDDAFWVLSGLCYYGALISAALSFHLLLNNNTRAKAFSLVFAIIAAFTFGNGWIIFLLSAFALFREKKFGQMTVFLVTLFAVIGVFILSRQSIHPIAPLDWNPVDNTMFILIFLGNAFQFFYSTIIPLIVGLFISSVFIFSLFKKKPEFSSHSFLMLAFIICSACVAAPLRSGIEEGGHYGMYVRYGIFSILAFSLCIQLLFTSRNFSRKAMGGLACAAFLYNGLTGLFFYPEVVIRKEKMEVMIDRLNHHNYDVQFTTHPKDEVEKLFKEAIQGKIYMVEEN